MTFIKNLIALIVFFCVAILLVYVGVAVFLAALAIGLVAAVWYGIRFHFIRKELQETLREHADTRFHPSVRRDEPAGTVIEGEYVEVEIERTPEDASR